MMVATPGERPLCFAPGIQFETLQIEIMKTDRLSYTQRWAAEQQEGHTRI